MKPRARARKPATPPLDKAAAVDIAARTFVEALDGAGILPDAFIAAVTRARGADTPNERDADVMRRAANVGRRIIIPDGILGDEPVDDDELGEWLASELTREQWLRERLHRDLAPMFAAVGASLPPVRVSCGWTGSGIEAWTLGVCYDAEASAHKVAEIYLSPTIDDGATVLGVLMHELCHAKLGAAAEHDATYADLAAKVGLTASAGEPDHKQGPRWPEDAVPGAAMAERLAAICEKADRYPHGKVTPPPPTPPIVVQQGEGPGDGPGMPTPPPPPPPPAPAPAPGKAGAPLMRAQCPSCGYVIRVTMKFASMGLPFCGAHDEGETHRFSLLVEGRADS